MKRVLKIVIGIIFIISAFAKLASADIFELYVYGFEFFSFGIACLAARLIISAELGLGLWMILNCDAKWSTYTALGMLGGFTVFLIYISISGNTENCHCFGELIDFTPKQSIIKNGAMIALLLFSLGGKSFNIRYKPLWRSLIAIASLAIVFITSPPDNWRYENYKNENALNEDALKSAIETGILPSEIFKGDKIICFYSLKCEFCNMSAQKLGVMRRQGSFSESEIIAVIGRNQDEHITEGIIHTFEENDSEEAKHFFTETRLDCNKWCYIKVVDFIRITNGYMPLIIHIKDGMVIDTYGYRDLH